MTKAVRPVFQAPAGDLKPFVAVDPSKTVGKAYLRIMVRDQPGVAPDSDTETFIALRCDIDNWRWAGVPFYLRTEIGRAHV